MSSKWGKGMVVIALIAILSIVLPGPALAQVASGEGPGMAMVPGGWKSVNIGEHHWFAFDYDKHETDPIQIELFAQPKNGAKFTVLTPDQAEHWRKTGEYKWVGAGTENPALKDRLSWTGSFASSGTYYVVVEHSKLGKTATEYNLVIKSKSVSFPVVGVKLPVAPAPAAAPAKPAALTGTGPDYPMQPTKEWAALNSSEPQWFAFKYDFNKDKAMKPVEIRLYSEPVNSVVLTVHTAQQAEVWRHEGKLQHLGCCTNVTEDKNKDGKPDYAIWAGNLGSTGTYYIVVKRAEGYTGPASYQMAITGDGVSFPTIEAKPASAAAPAAAPAPVAAKPVTLVGTGPDYAMQPMMEWATLNHSEPQWFAFKYDFDKEKAMNPVEVRLYSEPPNSVVLTVHSAQQAEVWRHEGKFEHLGCCTNVTEDKNQDGKPDYAIWAGKLGISGTYYIVVKRAEGFTGSASYQMVITGDGVSY